MTPWERLHDPDRCYDRLRAVADALGGQIKSHVEPNGRYHLLFLLPDRRWAHGSGPDHLTAVVRCLIDLDRALKKPPVDLDNPPEGWVHEVIGRPAHAPPDGPGPQPDRDRPVPRRPGGPGRAPPEA